MLRQSQNNLERSCHYWHGDWGQSGRFTITGIGSGDLQNVNRVTNIYKKSFHYEVIDNICDSISLRLGKLSEGHEKLTKFGKLSIFVSLLVIILRPTIGIFSILLLSSSIPEHGICFSVTVCESCIIPAPLQM